MLLLLVASLLAALAGCRAPVPAAGPGGPSATAGCLPSAVPPDTASAVPPGSGSGTSLPGLTLPCFAGGGSVRLSELHRPAVLNLWASWCAPCRSEMPAIERYAAAHGDRVAVIGVDTSDTRSAGASVIEDLRITYPNLYDQDKRLLDAVGRGSLPTTLFVDAQGRLRYIYNQPRPLDEQAVAVLVREYLGVTG